MKWTYIIHLDFYDQLIGQMYVDVKYSIVIELQTLAAYS